MHVLSDSTQQRQRPLNATDFYTSRGLPIFPCRGKTPLTEDGFYSATTDPAQIAAWRGQFPWANIAIRTGPPWWTALDADPKKGGLKALGELVKDIGAEAYDTLRFNSGSGGEHLLYTLPPGVTFRNSSGLLAPGLDIR